MPLPRGLEYTMPILVMNLGGEMLYVLEQRLIAQSIDEKKKSRVLCDVARTMFSKRFVSELFKPQSMYADESIRQVFEKLAHSSIMKLNETSMNKLYSLMVMGVKYQLVKCVSARRMLDVTLEHVEQIRLMCQNRETDQLIDECRASCLNVYGSFDDGDWLLCRHALLQFFKDRKVRVSVFLQMKVQSSDGTLVLDGRGPLPEHSRIPGTVLLRHFSSSGRTSHDDGSWLASKISHHPLAHDCLQDEDHGTSLARALSASVYKGERISPASPRDGDDDDDEKTDAFPRPWSSPPTSPPPLVRRSTAKEELNILSDLVAGQEQDEKEGRESEVLTLDFFAKSERREDGPTMTMVNGVAERKSAQDMLKDLLDFDAKDDRDGDLRRNDDAKRRDDDDDLFDLLDESK